MAGLNGPLSGVLYTTTHTNTKIGRRLDIKLFIISMAQRETHFGCWRETHYDIWDVISGADQDLGIRAKNDGADTRQLASCKAA